MRKNKSSKSVMNGNRISKHERLFYRGVELYESGAWKDALAAFDQAIEAKPDYHEALHDRAVILEHLGQFEDAIASYDQALKIKAKYLYYFNKHYLQDKMRKLSSS